MEAHTQHFRRHPHQPDPDHEEPLKTNTKNTIHQTDPQDPAMSGGPGRAGPAGGSRRDDDARQHPGPGTRRPPDPSQLGQQVSPDPASGRQRVNQVHDHRQTHRQIGCCKLAHDLVPERPDVDPGPGQWGLHDIHPQVDGPLLPLEHLANVVLPVPGRPETTKSRDAPQLGPTVMRSAKAGCDRASYPACPSQPQGRSASGG